MRPSPLTKVPNFQFRCHIGTIPANAGLVFTTTIVSLFTLLFILPTKAHAQTTSLAVWPPLLEATIQPGKTITQVFRLKNLGDDTTITAQVIPFSPSDELGHVQLQGSELQALADPNEIGTSSEPSNIIRNFSLLNADLEKSLPTTFPLKAGQTQELVLKIKIPKDQPQADHYLTFLFSSHTTGLIGGSGVTTQASIGSNLLLTISNDGQPSRSAKIEEFRVVQGNRGSELVPNLGILDSFSPLSFLLRLKNTGTTRFKAIGQVELKNTFAKSIATLPVREDNVLAGSIRQLVIEPWKPIFPLGRYTATATITPQDSNLPISSTINFFIFPYKAILVIILLFGFFRLTKRTKQ